MNTKLISTLLMVTVMVSSVYGAHSCNNMCKTLPYNNCKPQGQMVWVESEQMIYILVRCGAANAPSVSKFEPKSGDMQTVSLLPLDKGAATFFSSLLEVTSTHYFVEVLAMGVTTIRAYDRNTLTYSDIYFPDGPMDLAVDPQNAKTYVCEGKDKKILKYNSGITDTAAVPQTLYPDIQCENLILRRNSLFWYSYNPTSKLTTFFNGDINGVYAPDVMFNFAGQVNDFVVTDTSIYFATNDDIIHADYRGNVKNSVMHGANSLVVVDNKAFLTTTGLVTSIELVDYDVCQHGGCGLSAHPNVVMPPSAYTHTLSHDYL